VNPVSEHELSIPKKARESFDKGIQLVVQKSDYRGAIAQFTRAISQYPSYYEAYAAMGLAQSKIGDQAEAEKSLQQSIGLSQEKFAQAMLDLASIFNSKNRFSEAEPLLRKAVSLDASSWRGQYELAVSLRGQKRYSDAVASATAARDLKPDNPQIYLLLYNLHIQTDNFPAALADTEAYLKLVPDGALSDRVRKLQDQIRKNAPSRAKDPANSSPGPVPPAPVAATSVPEAAASSPAAPKEITPAETSSDIPLRVDELVPPMVSNITCSLPQVLYGASQRADELLNSLQKFAAAERVEHYKSGSRGTLGAPDVRSFDYVVTINQDKHGGFRMQEYRNGTSAQPQQFPSGIVTANLSVHGLIFHRSLAAGFNFTCEGLGEWNGHPTWLVRFNEKPNQLNPLRSYNVGGLHYPLLLTGRAWIDAGNYNLLRLESDLAKPVDKIQLKREHIAIEFASVQFRTSKQQLWLPQSADLYVEWGGRRFYRRHTFSKFQLFSTDTVQQVDGPKESYCFTNTSNLLITGVLEATPVSGKAVKPPSLTLTIPAKGTVCTSVGPGKELNIAVQYLASTTFTHDGPAGSVEVDAYQLNANALEIIPNKNVSPSPNR
jgi:tetratricopeptide (TPR) repeat protein